MKDVSEVARLLAEIDAKDYPPRIGPIEAVFDDLREAARSDAALEHWDDIRVALAQARNERNEALFALEQEHEFRTVALKRLKEILDPNQTKVCEVHSNPTCGSCAEVSEALEREATLRMGLLRALIRERKLREALQAIVKHQSNEAAAVDLVDSTLIEAAAEVLEEVESP